MTLQQRRTARLSAVLALFALIATACGAVVTASEQRAALSEAAVQPAPGPGAVAPGPGAAPAGTINTTVDAAPTQPGGHNWGTSISEWNEQGSSSSGLGEATPGYSDIEWADLIPAGSSGEELLARFEEQLDAVVPGTDEAETLYAEIQALYNPEATNADLEGEQIRLLSLIHI